MVYCGKPSKGCETCRSRKIRCDQAVPVCGQCTKLNKECPGYRNQLDLSFRDESSHVIRKAASTNRMIPARPKVLHSTPAAGLPESSPYIAAAGEASFVSYPSFSQGHSHSTLDSVGPIVRAPSPTIHPTTEERGLGFFSSNYVLAASGPSNGIFSYLSELCREEGMDGTLKFSMVATGLAGCANLTKSPSILQQARKQYTIALRNVNEALQCPLRSIKNGTLFSILVLSIFENITGRRQLSLKAWTDHVNGAATLLQIRGRAQLKSSVGLPLFLHASTSLLTSCIQREMAMPTQTLELRKEALDMVAPGPAQLLMLAMEELTVLRGAVAGQQITDIGTIIERALTLDTKFQRIFSNVPFAWRYETIVNAFDSEMAYKGSYDIYYDIWIAQCWNAMRLCRIFLNELIRTSILKDLNSSPESLNIAYHAELFQHSHTVLVEMRDGILRSVPQHTGHISRKPFYQHVHPEYNLFSMAFSSDSTSTQAHPNPGARPEIPSPPQMLGGLNLLWPLYVAGITRVSTPTTRKLVINHLWYIGDTMGVRQGIGLANFLEAASIVNHKDSVEDQLYDSLVKPNLQRWRQQLSDDEIQNSVERMKAFSVSRTAND